ncbi:MAG: metallophosphoesterase [Pseudomonadota bacterium]|nr:metallophosphoesterase [Pseudomonadota bacterium]
MAKEGFFKRLRSRFPAGGKYEEVRLREPYPLGTVRVRVPWEGVPICVNLGPEGPKLHIYPETPLDDSTDSRPQGFVLLDPKCCHLGINGFLRLARRGDSLVLGHQDKQQMAMFNYPDSVDMRHLEITHDGDGLIFRKLVSDARVQLSPVAEENAVERNADRRWERLGVIRAIYGGRLEPLSPREALQTLEAVNEILGTEAYRTPDDRGRPGGVVRIPNGLTPIIVGDLHAQVDNLLTLLTQNGFLEALETAEAALIILGDAVHSEVEGQMDEMESSLLMMDLILRLKLRFPRQVFYIRGNHDSFSQNEFKFGVAQCLVWESTLRSRRGMGYLREMERFYDGLPYLVLSDGYVACHAAPIKTKFNLDRLVNIHRHPGLVQELTHNRLRRRTSPAGYTAHDVKHFRETMNLPENTPFFVSHSPLNREDPLWLNAGGIKNHHIVFSANLPWIGVFTRIRGQMVPLSYHREDLVPAVNALAS